MLTRRGGRRLFPKDASFVQRSALQAENRVLLILPVSAIGDVQQRSDSSLDHNSLVKLENQNRTRLVQKPNLTRLRGQSGVFTGANKTRHILFLALSPPLPSPHWLLALTAVQYFVQLVSDWLCRSPICSLSFPLNLVQFGFYTNLVRFRFTLALISRSSGLLGVRGLKSEI